MADILRKNGISVANVFFNTKMKHKSADIVDQIRWHDYVWKDDNDNIIAFWDRKTEKLMF